MSGAGRGLERAVPRAHGLFNLLSGLWPFVSMRSFESVVGPKEDRWLVYTVGGLLATTGWAQLRMPATSSGVRSARRLGLGSAGTLLAIDLANAPSGRISRVYLVDAAMEAAWLGAWALTWRKAHSASEP
jgi:hypothetical protein